MPRKKLYQDEETVTLSIRLPASLRDEVRKRSITQRRSLNQEIVWLIQTALEMVEKERVPEEE